MRKVMFSTLVVVAIMATMVGPAWAQAPGPGTWNVGFTMANLSSTDAATVHIDFKKADGSSAGTWDGSIVASGSQFLYSGSISGLEANSESAATISSNTQLAVVANMASAGPKAEGAYSGINEDQTNATLYAPGVYKNYYNNVSNIRVQNTGSSATCVRISYFAKGSATATTTEAKTVLAGTAKTFTQADNSGLADGFIGSGKIESIAGSGVTGCASSDVAAQKLAAIVNIVLTPGPSVGNPTAYSMFGSYNAIISGASQAYLPVLANKYYGNTSSLTVLNLRSTAQWVRVSYSSGQTKEKQVAANSSNLWYTPNEGPAVGWFGGAKVECITAQGGTVTTDCEIVATVNQMNDGSAAPTAKQGFAAYNGFTSGSVKFSLPIVNRRYATAYGGYTTSVTCQNISSQTTDVSLTLTGGNTVPNVTSVGQNGKAFWYLNSASYTGVASGFNGSATATALNSAARIVCIGQQNGETPPAGQEGDWLTTYNGIAQ